MCRMNKSIIYHSIFIISFLTWIYYALTLPRYGTSDFENILMVLLLLVMVFSGIAGKEHSHKVKTTEDSSGN